MAQLCAASNDGNDDDLEQLETASEVFCKLIQVHDHVIIVISERKIAQFFFVSAACGSKMKRYNIAEVTIWALAALATLHSTNCLGKSFYLLHFLIRNLVFCYLSIFERQFGLCFPK